MFEGNPFPGLRPFEFDENYLFFGREEQVAQLLSRLGNTRFLAVVGASGSGKSSLVRAGLLPELHGGTMTGTSIAWELAIMRPGGDPLTNLAESLVDSGLFGEANEENVLQTRATLSRSGLGLIEAYRQSNIEKGSNLLLLVDQFEEIFRFRQSGAKASQEAAHFIQLLLETSRQSEVPVYIILTMRSDFLGDCAEFAGLAEAVNEGEYLIPRLNRKQRTRAIEGPVKVGGAEISPRLKQQLLNDIGDDPDQLPILQHALMRMWEHWQTHAEPDQPLDLEHYDAIGRMTEALSRHADEVYAELPDDAHRQLCMKLFKAITEKQADGRGIRRPLPFGEINEISGQQREQLMAVIDAYRPAGRTFIMPGEQVTIHDQTIIDISHESLMRVWNRLKDWVREEADSARIYVRLCETAELHNRSEAGLYRDPDLKIALAWREQHKPNAQWAQRINESFDLSMEFLDDSKEDFEAEQRAKEEARKRELEQAQALAEAEQKKAEVERKSAKRNKVFAAFLFALASLAIILALQANKAKKQAVASEKQAVESEVKAKNALSDAQLIEAERLVDENAPQAAIALLTKSHRENPEYSILLERAFSIADTQKIPFYEGELVDNKAHVMLWINRGFQYDLNEHTAAMLHKEKGNSFVSVYDLESGNMLFRTPKLEFAETVDYSPDGKHLVVACKTIEGNWDGVIVYDVKTGKEVRKLETTPSLAIFGAVSNDLNDVVAGTDKGEVFHWDHTKETKGKILQVNDKIWEVKIHPVKRSVAIIESKGHASYKFYYKDLESEGAPKLLYTSPDDQQRFMVGCRFSPSGDYLALWGGSVHVGSFIIYDGGTVEELFMDETAHTRAIFSLRFSPDESVFATCSTDKTVRLWNQQTYKTEGEVLLHKAEVWNGEFSPDQSRFATLTSDGSVGVWSTKTKTLTHDYVKHNSPLALTAFSKDGKSVYAGLTDGKIHKWSIAEGARLPVLISHEEPLVELAVDPKGELILSSAEDGKIRVWNPQNYTMVREIVASTNNVTGGDVWQMDFNREGTRLGTFQKDSPLNALSFRLWSWPDADPIAFYQFPVKVEGTAFSPDGKTIAYSNAENFEFIIYDVIALKTLHVNRDHGDRIFNIGYSLDGKYVATASFDGNARVYTANDLNQICDPLPFGFSYGSHVSFSSDSKYLVTRTNVGRDENFLVIWEIATGKEKHRFEHSSGIMNHHFSSDGKRFFTCGKDNVTKMWSLEDGKLISVFKQSEYVLSVEELPGNPSRIITVDQVGSARIWDIKLGKVVDGPFKGVKGFDWWQTKGLPLSGSSAFVSSYGRYSAALWVSPISSGEESLNPQLGDYLENFVGGEMDESFSFVLRDRKTILKNKSILAFDRGDKNLKRWVKWRTGQQDDYSNSYREGLSRQKLVDFLLSQNTTAATHAALEISPMNKVVMKQLEMKYGDLVKKETDKKMQEFYRLKRDWYSKASE